ncbi:HEPN/Toprim-associated domain-containing protein [Streptomyces sp. NRRL B-3229]|uniref:HEPN/Toprim-associated domain-containing protein n=1 Tax=Streptomyces sp. NRRL B-3229 TaxID=1463836 RepID=UPI0004C1150A|nr:HEPN/Toprim-associated domain-containing protein [Streptomyces sp. NRRL B-3229]
MGHHSCIEVHGHQFLLVRDGYLPEFAALFTEDDRRVTYDSGPDGEGGTRFVYLTTVASLRERLQVQGFTAAQSRSDLALALRLWSSRKQGIENPDAGSVELAEGEEDLPGACRQWAWRSSPLDWSSPVPSAHEVEREMCNRLSRSFDDLTMEELLAYENDPLDVLSWYMNPRSFLRLLLEHAADPAAEASLDLSPLTGCCTEMPTVLPVAAEARADQLAELALNAPLLVLTEGPTDARLLAQGMEVTHPHLKGFVNFFDYASASPEGGVSALARTVSAFVAAGVANRFIAIADNDTEGHAGLHKIKGRSLPDRCRVLHYPSLPLLESYPTIGPTSELPVLANVNERAGSLEMYLGRDVLEADGGGLMPVQWRSHNEKLRRYHGSLSDDDKRLVQERFVEKARACKAGHGTGNEDWSGVRAIIETIIGAFD